jgi:hypothetical protein
MNRFDKPRDLLLSLSGVQPRSVNVIGLGRTVLPVKLRVEADKVRSVRVLVTLDKARIKTGEQRLTFTLRDAATNEARDVSAVFLAGGAR